ncbi:hypothetical protein [Tsukamurella pulmonis]|uniref:hypothetical protein n=1 Tax=Tsukamurella pulmonis TaxID=47312 RepID=UPI000A848B68|nr:hypothetical protein [Tsukamurella pulmonis]
MTRWEPIGDLVRPIDVERRELDVLFEQQLQEWIARWAADVPETPELDARIIAAVRAAPAPPDLPEGFD